MAMTTETEPAARPARRSKVATVSATEMGRHLDLSRQRIVALADEGVIPREADGTFPVDAGRIGYLRWLRDPARRSAKSAADGKFVEAKTRLLEIRTMERLGQLWPREACEAVLDTFVAAVTAELLSIPARVALTDLATRRKLDAVVHATRKSIHARLGDKLAEFKGDGADTDDDDA